MCETLAAVNCIPAEDRFVEFQQCVEIYRKTPNGAGCEVLCTLDVPELVDEGVLPPTDTGDCLAMCKEDSEMVFSSVCLALYKANNEGDLAM